MKYTCAVAVTVYITLVAPASLQAGQFPTCSGEHSDPDGDGYGWENGTCLVELTKNTDAVSEPYSVDRTDECVDTVPLNDGWGWNGHSSCKVTSAPQTNAPVAIASPPAVKADTNDATECIDTTPLNDGWGWDGEKSCRVIATTRETNITPFQKHGKLNVCKRDYFTLCNQHGHPVQLTGMSSHGIHWSGWHNYDRNGCLTETSLDLLAHDWDTEIFRIAMYVKYGGYESNPEESIRHVNTLISELSDRGMYAIVDFHILAGSGVSGNPLDYTGSAEEFFRRIVRDNAERQNVLYEIANEPQGSDLTWGQIKHYADTITHAIRDEEHPNNNAVVIVGTDSWSSFGLAANGDIFDIVDNPVRDSADNLMYAFHFYASDPTHNAKGYLDALGEAVHHFPVFVTEWGTQNASGGGDNDFNRARDYVNLMRERNISWTMWNFSDTEESSAVWNDTSFCSGNQDWHNHANLSPTGRFIRDIFAEK